MRTLKYLGAAAAVLLLAALALGWLLLRASLPRLEGALAASGLTGAVRITRDSRGVPTIEATDRADLAYATGFVHAQDRYFQMDLSRRLAAGELAELFGGAALEQDRRARLFRFRSVAREVLAQAAPAERALLEAYARGVNAGLADLAGRPWEYWVLGAPPLPWRPEDTILIEHAMWWDLQANGLRREILRQEINARLGGAQCGARWKCGLGFLYPAGTSWDAPVAPAQGAVSAAEAAVPPAEVLDVRNGRAAAAVSGSVPREPAAGSNSWAVAGRLTATGAALVANDMHLGLRIPPLWYHARLRIASGAAQALDLNGVTLPGAPLLVAGSNGHIAWGFTNSYGTWLDVSRVPCTAVGQHELTTPSGPVALSVVREEIRVHGQAAVVMEVKSAPAGVLLRADEAQHSCWFGAWLAQNPAATNLGLMALERATSVAEALALAPAVGIPHQNVVIGDEQGHIGWTIYGRIPADTGATRASGGAPWTTVADHPRIVDPPLGRIWTANARVASDDHQLRLIGGDVAALGAQYDLGARAGQIRDDLLALQGNITPADMLRIQLDDRAVFLARWRTLLLSVLDEEALHDHPRRAELRQLIEGWNARASVDSVGYRLVRAYHERTRQAVWDMLLAGLGLEAEQGAAPPAQFEGPLWQLVSAQPLHLLAKSYPGWPQFLRAQVDATIAELGASCRELAHCTWGAHNLVQIRHPLSRVLPWLASFLDMPTLELPGDHDMPRVQDGAIFGASERFAVSPGHEEQGYLQLPGGQSGHPLSPYYHAGFMQWARGTPLPFLPGPAEHTLILTPN
ncbi:MAG: penicillin acylase family protein [Gammaproteobacteria bacterium]|nr:MAG: penicillin acylase family protein [Gammaproteobacteria bacterium]